MTDSLTFGIELEFIVVYRRGNFDSLRPNEDPSTDTVDAKDAIYSVFASASIPVGFQSPDHDLWCIHSDGLLLSAAEMAVLPVNHCQEAIEISSRKLSFSDDWQEELRDVLDALRYMRGTYGCEFITNHTTGLHVHISDVSGISLTTAKRLTQIASVHERQLDQLHDANRIPPLMPSLYGNPNSVPQPLYAGLSFFYASSDTDYVRKFDVLGRVEDIEAHRTVESLASIHRVQYRARALNGHNCTLNLDNLYPDRLASRHSPPPKGTVEFRQHTGTLHHVEIVNYVKVLYDLVTFCNTASDDELINMLVFGVNNTYGLQGFLGDIYCDEEIIEYFCNRPPRTPVQASAQILQPLKAINAQESAQRSSSRAVQAAIVRKIQLGLYGLDFDDDNKGAIALGPQDYTWMLTCAKNDLVASGEHPHGETFESQARQDVFRKLAGVYQNLLQDDDRQTAMDKEVGDWVSKYGPP